MAKLKKIKSLYELAVLASTNAKYAELVIAAAENLGGSKQQTANVQAAMEWLKLNAMEAGEGGEEMVVGEVNFVIKLL